MLDHYSKMHQNAKKHDAEVHICGNNKGGKTNATQKFNSLNILTNNIFADRIMFLEDKFSSRR